MKKIVFDEGYRTYQVGDSDRVIKVRLDPDLMKRLRDAEDAISRMSERLENASADELTEISNEIKSRVEFKEHNLLKDPYQKGYHFIVCRNVLIYFTEEAKDDIFMKFGQSLCDGGIFFIGSTEQIMNHRRFGFERRNSFYYEKKDDLLK